MAKGFLHKKRKLRTQVTILITVTIACALVISSVLFCYKTINELQKSFKEQILQESRSTISAISTNIDTIDSIYRILISNTSVYNWLESNYADSTNSVTTAKQITSSLIMNNLWEKNYLESVYIYNKRGKQIHVSKNETSDSLITNRRIYNSLASPSPSLSFGTFNDSNCIYFIKTIYSSNNGQQIGDILISININEWMTSLSQYVSDDWRIFIYNDDLEVMSGFKYNAESTNLSAIHNQINAIDTLKISSVKFDSDDYFVLSNEMEAININAAVLAPVSQIEHQIYNILLPYIITIISIIIIVLIFAFGISRLITQPISLMINYVNRIAQGDYSGNINGLEKYKEFYSLQLSVNNMLDEIHSFHEDITEQKLLLKDSEIRALQSQINPHFLFNVLNAIAWKAEMSDNNEIYDMTIALGELLKATVQSKNDFTIPLSEELKYVKFYSYLQRIRFEDRISINFHIDAGLDSYKVPVFCIQTLVENAYVHGLEPKESSGELNIYLYEKYEYLHISIEDNGIGFNEIPDFNNHAPSSEESGTSKGHTHVGLRNLNRRLILMYGPECALHIESTSMVKTAISFKIPCEK